MLWEDKKAKIKRGPTVRKATSVPKPATYQDPTIKNSMLSISLFLQYLCIRKV